ncbi:MAG: methylenetetrahydrofolate--tRNA-(uracil(54)-C(5))-methyltransferase (FADH(2)-oxidizing) TrmFO [Deltaproteobacteria bacterium]|jgi:methylenetetrahydrofolate--tRNA-(uracil-5-)-methyltransferase|nr:methylenetetrahydrofolate--tRNA-(uracil(54)-C(5))-methyltransferase (FADH(2)-oxidizing) TrmFO [Deltaproteobacteria bacterium]
MTAEVHVIGGGLAGSEAALRLAANGLRAVIWEMKPAKFSPAHRLATLAELVCSNSLRSDNPEKAVGLLKLELEGLGSVVMKAAHERRVPAGRCLAVDRVLFSQTITEILESHPLVTIKRAEFLGDDLPSDPLIIAAGPLASEPIVDLLKRYNPEKSLYFYDALAPIVTYESLDLTKMYQADRYGAPNEGDYLNCPLTKEEYAVFYEALVAADKVEPRSFEENRCFEGCLPIEIMASRGPKTLAFGPMKPVGLNDPKTGLRPAAVVQLRRENLSGTLWNLVGFQTRLTRPAQDKVFRLIPGLEKAEFSRYGAIHRNTYVEAPAVLDPFQRLKSAPSIFIAGQLSGVEGYVESAAQGLWAGENAARLVQGLPLLTPPRETALGSLLSHLESFGGRQGFAPSNINFGLFPAITPLRTSESTGARRLSAAQAAWGPFLKEINYAHWS